MNVDLTVSFSSEFGLVYYIFFFLSWFKLKLERPYSPLNSTMLCIKTILGYFREGCKLENCFYQTHNRLHSRLNKRQEEKYICSKAIRGEDLPNSPFCIPILLPISLQEETQGIILDSNCRALCFSNYIVHVQSLN